MRGPPALLPQKVRRPVARGLARERLDERLRGPEEPGLVLVVAPPGAGKTTLLTQLAAAPSTRAAWYSAGPEDAHPGTLTQYLARALLGDRSTSLRGGAPVDDLLAAIGDVVSPGVTLIVDDAHEIAGTDAEEALERFLRLRPKGVRVVLGSRRPPGFDTPRMLASGDLLQIDGEDLRFRSWEVEELFRDVYGEPLSPEAAARLTRRVGGHAAALQLFHLSTAGRSRAEREAEVVDLSGRSPLIHAYLARTVLAALDHERRDFLLRTAVLGVLDGPMCDDLLGREGSGAVLRRLERDQLFTTSTDGGLTYRYHQVLRSHLEVMLVDELPATEVTDLYRRAGVLLERAGHRCEALHAYVRAEDRASAARVVRHSRVASRDDDGWPASTPDLLRDDPWMTLARVRRLLHQGAVEAAGRGLRAVQDASDPALRAHCFREQQLVALWQGGSLPVGGGPSVLAAVRQLTRRAVPPTAVGLAPAEEQFLAGLSGVLRGQLPSARRDLGSALTELDPHGWPRITAGLLATVLDFHEVTATRRWRVVEELGTAADIHGYPWLARVSRGIQACVVLEATGQRWRSAACRGVVRACASDGDRWGELVLRTCAAVTYARTGESGAALDELGAASARAGELDAPVLAVWLDAITAAVRELAGTAEPDARTRLAQRAASVGIAEHADVLQVCRSMLGDRSRARPPRAWSDRGAPSAETTTRLECLGGFRVLVDGTEVDLSALRPRARELLMLLALHHGHDVHRAELIEQFWPDVPAEPATHRLQVAMSSARRLLEKEGAGWGAVQRRGDAYRLQLPGAAVDTHLLEEGVARLVRLVRGGTRVAAVEQVTEILSLYRGDLLPEAGTAEWVLAERDRLRVLTAAALTTAARSCLEWRWPDHGLAAARRAVELDPLRDTAWWLLAQTQDAMGDSSAALATRAEYDRVTAELSVRPPTAGRRPAG